MDQSCLDWHDTNDPGSTWRCYEVTHVIQNHLTTPMFVRMGQRDDLIGTGTVNNESALPGQPPIDIGGFARLVRAEIMQLEDLQSLAEEASEVTMAPGAFSPTCEKHETLRSDDDIFDATIESGGIDLAMFDVMANWLAGTDPKVVYTPRGGTEFCPGENPFPVCPKAPAPGCRETTVAGKSVLKLKDKADDTADLLRWNLPKGEIVDPDDFGDPPNGYPAYRFCVWEQFVNDEGKPDVAPVLGAAVPAAGTCKDGKPCWKATGKGFKYVDPDRSSDGIKVINLVGNATKSGKSKIVVVGKGEELPFELDPPLLPLEQDPKITAQLANSDGFCWQAEFSASILNDGAAFRARSD